MPARWVKPLFLLAALYDGVLGVAFCLKPLAIFDAFDVTPPNHEGYVQFSALLLLVFAWMFLRIALDPVGRREQMLYGVGLKLAYCGTVFGHELAEGIPSMWLPWAWADLAFLVAFLLAWRATGKRATA